MALAAWVGGQQSEDRQRSWAGGYFVVAHPASTWVLALLQSTSSTTMAVVGFFRECDGMLVTLVLKIFSDGLFLPCTTKGKYRPSTACLVACLSGEPHLFPQQSFHTHCCSWDPTLCSTAGSTEQTQSPGFKP